MTSDPYGGDKAARYVAAKERNPARRLSRWLEARAVLRTAGGGGLVLDMPSGVGRFPHAIACDRSATMAELAHAAGRRTVRGDAFALPFADGAFDHALCVRLLHHFDASERRRMLHELARVAPVAVITYFGTKGHKAKRRAARKKSRTRRAVSSKELAADCAAARWRVVSDRAVIPFWSEQRVVRLERK
jgi:SAM-dependent methyltransferase